MFDYSNLFKLLEEKNISTYYLRKNKVVGESTLTKLRNNEHVSTLTILKFCMLLDVQPNDLIVYVKEKKD